MIRVVCLCALVFVLNFQGYGQITSFPYLQDFEADDGGWIAVGVEDVWEWGEPSGSSLRAAHSGAKVWGTNLAGVVPTSTENHILESPVFDLSSLSLPVISFQKQHHASFNSLTFEFSVDDGLNYEILRTYDPNRSEFSFAEEKISLFQAIGKSSVKFRFVFRNSSFSTPEGMVLDDFSVVESTPNDLKILDEDPILGSEFVFSTQEQITVPFRNIGSNAQENVVVGMMLTMNDIVLKETTSSVDRIEPGGLVSFTFPETVDMSVKGLYGLKLFVGAGEDVNRFNDTLNYKINHVSVIDTGLPYSENFEELTRTTIESTLAFEGLKGWNAFDPEFPITYTIGNTLGLFRDHYLNANVSTSENTGRFFAITIDLSEYDIAADSLYLDLKSISDGNRTGFELYYKSDENASEIFVGSSGFNPDDLWIHNHFDLKKKIDQGGGFYSSTSQFVFRPDFIPTRNIIIDDLRLYSIDDNEVRLSYEDSSPHRFNKSIDINIHPLRSRVNGDFIIRTVISDGVTSVEVENMVVVDGNESKFTFSIDDQLSEPGEYLIESYLFKASDPQTALDSAVQNILIKTSLKPSLPFEMNFEGLTPQILTEDNFSIGDLEGAVFEKEGSGNLRILNSYGYRSNNSVELGTGADFTLTLDLSEYDTAQHELFIDFVFIPNLFIYEGSEDPLIRINELDEWIELPLLRDVGEASSTAAEGFFSLWIRYRNVSLTEALKRAKKNFSKTTEIQLSGASFGFNILYDQLIIYEGYDRNLELLEFYSPKSFIDASEISDEDFFTAQVVNRGVEIESSFAISLENLTNEEAIYVEEFSDQNLAPGDTLTISLRNPFDLSKNGEYEFFGQILSDSDQFSFDGKKTTRTYNRSFIGELPYELNADLISTVEDTITTFGEFLSLPGYFFDSNLDNAFVYATQFTPNESIFFSDSNTYDVLRAANLTSLSSTQDHVWTFDLEDYNVEENQIVLELFYFLRSSARQYGEDDGLYVRGSKDDDWINVFLHDDPDQNKFFNFVDDSLNISSVLMENNQLFSSSTQVKISALVGYRSSAYRLRNFELFEYVELVKPLHLDDGLGQYLYVYPNPTNDYLIVENDRKFALEIRDLAGKQVFLQEETTSKANIDLTYFTAGTYIIHINQGDEIISRKIIVK